MQTHDEPIFPREFARDFEGERQEAVQEASVRDRIRGLLDEQPFAVLCTQGGGQPYGSVVAYAAGEDLRSVVFATPVATRKFSLLRECSHVALVVDSRASWPDDMMEVEAITATGRATRLVPGPELDWWAGRLAARHPQLSSFVAAPSSALFRIDIVRYLHVSRFQEVRQWLPDCSW